MKEAMEAKADKMTELIMNGFFVAASSISLAIPLFGLEAVVFSLFIYTHALPESGSSQKNKSGSVSLKVMFFQTKFFLNKIIEYSKKLILTLFL